MRGLEFPIIGTKVKGLDKRFNLSDPGERKKYFEAKVGDEIKRISKYLKNNHFVAYLLGKKNSGKGTYSKLFTEIFEEDRIALVSVGDVIRDIHGNWKRFSKSGKIKKLKDHYRGYISFDEAADALLNRSVEKLLPTEFILTLLKLRISELKGESIFIDGLPREVDQVSYSLYFRDIIKYPDEKDFFVIIDIPESVIEERIKYRVICPKCLTSRNKKLLITSKVEYDMKTKEFYLVCDNPRCKGARMVSKESDNFGTGPIRQRLLKDEEIIQIALKLHGIPKILLRNHVPVSETKKYFDGYEITPEYEFKWDPKKKKVRMKGKEWTIYDDNGVESYSLLAAPVVVSMIKQLVEVLNL